MSEVQKVLLVDDEPRNLKILHLSLDKGLEIKSASNGEEALEIVKSFIPDIIILDIMMPGIDGYEVCRNIKSQNVFELTKIILVSGKAMIEEKLKGYESGADDYITKPFISEELLAKTRVFLKLTSAEKQLKKLNTSLEAEIKVRVKQLMEAEAKLMQSAKMSALGEMAGGIAHEINTPLTTMNLYAEQIQDLCVDLPSNGKLIEKTASGIKITIQRIAKIVSGLRSFSRDSSHDPFTIHQVQSILNETLDFCSERFIQHGVKLTCDPVPSNLSLFCRPEQISQVILNLLNNSYDAVEKLDEKWIHLSVKDEGDQVEVKVANSGPKIPDEIVDKIFQPFFTTKELNRGTGLGLSISKGLIEDHHGSLALDLKSDSPCFIIKLPKTADK
jgi:C4-dicarboxylate-specific signal transduction histidine kinase